MFPPLKPLKIETYRMNAPDKNGSITVKSEKMLIDGEWVGAADGRELPVEAPGTRAIIAHTPRGNAEDIARAVNAAEAAFSSWSRVAPRDRGRLLQKIADKLEERVEELSLILAEETGNALRTQARGEAASAVDIFRYFGGLASELKGETVPLGEHVLSYTPPRTARRCRRYYSMECASSTCGPEDCTGSLCG